MRSRFLSPRIAFFGRKKKKTEAPPRNGSMYRLNVLGRRWEWFAMNHRLPPGHFKNGIIATDLSDLATRDILFPPARSDLGAQDFKHVRRTGFAKRAHPAS